MPSDRTRRGLLAAGAAGLAGLAGCVGSLPGIGDGSRSTPTTSPPSGRELKNWVKYNPDWKPPEDAPSDAVRAETVVRNLKVPWDFAFAPNGDLFLTERVGRILRVNGGTSVFAEPGDVVDASAIDSGDEGGWWSTGGEDGLLGVAVHPRYPDRPYVYAYYTYPDDDAPEGKTNRVVRYDADADDVAATEETVVDGIPGHDFHNGGRISFGPRGYLWVTCGDGGRADLAQDAGSPGGSVLRVTPAGDPAPDNPDLEDRRIYSYGHRNPQGITWLPDGRPVCTEHGPSGHDEVNLLRPGDNYGWPEAREQSQYEGSDFHRPLANTGNTTWAPSGCTFYTGDGVPGWRNRLLAGCLRGQMVIALTLATEGRDLPPHGGDRGRAFEGWYDPALTAVAHRRFEDRFGRVRYVGQGPDGHPYAITSNRDGRAKGDFPKQNDDRLLKFVPE